jgi:release factor glutamine methyltransferase
VSTSSEQILARRLRAPGAEAAADDIVGALDVMHHGADDARLALLIGQVTFLGVELVVAPGALVPRVETELLARTALSLIPDDGAGITVLDICCGVGNLACALAVHRPALRVFATDLTDGTVALTRANVEMLGLGNRVTVVQGDLCASLAGHDLEGTIDLIVCNPPYISSSRLDTQSAFLLHHEPREAFDGGPYGLTIHQRVVRDALSFLRHDGWLCIEFGRGQERQLQRLFERAGGYVDLRFAHDEHGQPRVVAARAAFDAVPIGR